MQPASYGTGRRPVVPVATLACAALALLVGCGAPARAQTGVPYFARPHDAEGVEVRPGAALEPGLRRGLAAPSAAERWRDLPAYGRTLFDGDAAAFAPPEHGPVGPDYVLGPGDQLLVFLSGHSDTAYALTLDREGKVFLPRVGATFLWGLSFADAERMVRGRLASVLRNARVLISMGRMRTMDVFVLGDVRAPGRRTLSGLATTFQALVAAGGPSGRGSLRDVRVLRANRPVAQFDLYPFLLAGDRSNDVRLESGDVVFVGPCGPRAGVQGMVARPGVYELAGPCTLRRLLELAGGVTPFADLGRVQIERVDANGGFRLQDVALAGAAGAADTLRVADFDLVTVFALNERLRNAVTLDGYVRHPGSFELTPGLTLAGLLARERLLPEAALDHAQFSRVDSATFAVTVRDFSPRDVLEGRLDWPLRPLDAVTIFSTARMPRTVVLEGEVARPGAYRIGPDERLSSVLRRAGGPTREGALVAAVLTRPGAVRAEQRIERDLWLREQIELARQRARLEASGDSTNAGPLVGAQAQLLQALERASRPGRVALDLDEDGRWEGTARDPVLEDGDRFSVPLRPTTVAVLGCVRNPGTVLVRPGASAGAYVRMAGGAARDADRARSYLVRANGAAVSYRGGAAVAAGDAIVMVPRLNGAPSVARGVAGGARWVLDASVAAALLVIASRR